MIDRWAVPQKDAASVCIIVQDFSLANDDNDRLGEGKNESNL